MLELFREFSNISYYSGNFCKLSLDLFSYHQIRTYIRLVFGLFLELLAEFLSLLS
jgi:hypothetical protein